MNNKSKTSSDTSATVVASEWTPQNTPLSTEQVEDIINRIRLTKKYAKASLNNAVLREELNDLLDATGLFREVDDKKETTSKNAHHAYISDVFNDLAGVADLAIQLLSEAGISEYLSEVMSSHEITISPTATIGLSRKVLHQSKLQLDDIAGPDWRAMPESNDPFLPKAKSILNALDKILMQVQRHDLSPKLNAALRTELRKSRTISASQAMDGETAVTVDYAATMAHLRALSAATKSLSVFEQNQISKNRDRNVMLDSLLLSLAPIFLSTVGSDTSNIKLTTSFVNFATDVLQPFYPMDTLNPTALQKRWQRLKTEGQEETSKA